MSKLSTDLGRVPLPPAEQEQRNRDLLRDVVAPDGPDIEDYLGDGFETFLYDMLIRYTRIPLGRLVDPVDAFVSALKQGENDQVFPDDCRHHVKHHMGVLAEELGGIEFYLDGSEPDRSLSKSWIWIYLAHYMRILRCAAKHVGMDLDDVDSVDCDYFLETMEDNGKGRYECCYPREEVEEDPKALHNIKLRD